jgi:hypothetical protein
MRRADVDRITEKLLFDEQMADSVGAEGRRAPDQPTFTPFQKAIRLRICSALGFGSG